MSKWIQFVKQYASKNGLSYRDALKDPKCNALYRQEQLHGKGIISESIGMVKNAINKQVDKVMNGAKYLVPPSLKDTLSKYESNKIVSATLYRHPVDSWIRKSLNVLGTNKIPFDKLFHLRIFFTLDNGKEIFIEKNERLNSGIGMGAKKEGLETLQITSSDLPQKLTFGQLVEKTKAYQGDKFLTYSSSSNNCQYFIMAVLRANNFKNITKYEKFIKQNTEEIFANNPALRKIANTFTDLGAKANIIQDQIQGKGARLNNLRLIPHKHSMMNPNPVVFPPPSIQTATSTTGGKIHYNKNAKKQTKLDKEIYKLLEQTN